MKKNSSTEIRPGLYRQFVDLVCKRSGLNFADQFQYILLKVLKERIREKSLTFEEYFNYLAEFPEEFQQLLFSLTTGETYFFRFPQQLNIIRQKILPELFDKIVISSRQTIRIWSVGCSTGEEPYSIAMMLDEEWNNRSNNFNILGTDLNKDSLKRARRGLYNTRSFRMENLSFRNRYFTENQGDYELRKVIRDCVSFQESNLLNPLPLSAGIKRFHIILCRNVLIYFNPETVKRIKQYLFEQLEEGGYLLLGHSETLYEKEYGGQIQPHSHSIYQKTKSRDTIIRSDSVTMLPDSTGYFPVNNKTIAKSETNELSLPKRQAPSKEAVLKSWYHRGIQAYRNKEFTLAEKMFLESLARIPDSKDSILSLAYLYADMGEFDKAGQQSEKLLQTNALQAEAYFLKGLIALQKQQLIQAEKLLRRCVYCNEDHVPGFYHLGVILNDQGETDKAGKMYLHAWDLLKRIKPTYQEMPWEKIQFYRQLLSKSISTIDEKKSILTTKEGL